MLSKTQASSFYLSSDPDEAEDRARRLYAFLYIIMLSGVAFISSSVSMYYDGGIAVGEHVIIIINVVC
eukprot:scaffold1940_cov228-Ochromonas_danica.AAC.4